MARLLDPRSPRGTIAREFDDPRLELIRLLNEGCQVEHALLLQYLYAGFSVRRPDYDALVGSIDGASTTLLGIASQEMAHLRDVNQLLVELGAAPNWTRQDFPYEPGIYPFEMRLERLSRRSVAKYLFAEAPAGALESPREAGTPPGLAGKVREALGVGERFSHVGSLYARVIELFAEIGARGGERRSDAWARTIRAIKAEGETAHYEFFRAVFLGEHPALARLGERVWDDPDGETHPSLPLPDDPSAHPARRSGMGEPQLTLARLANHVYWSILVLLDLGYRAGGTRGREFTRRAVRLMTDALEPTAQVLASRRCGIPFDPLTTGCSPGLDLAENLALCRGLLEQAEALHRALDGELDGERSRRIRTVLAATRRALDAPARDLARQAPVLVAGAGPAGLAAAAALVSRHVPVRVVDRAAVLGGKVYSERDAAGRSHEHGVHGWWPGYLNFDRLLEEAGVDLDDALRPSSGGAIRMRDGRLAPLHDLAVRLPSPLFLFAHLLRAPYLRPWHALGGIPLAIHVLAFRHEDDYERYDGLTLEELADWLRVPEPIRSYLLRPFASAFDYAPARVVSASSILSALQFYLLPSSLALLPRWSRGLPEEKIFGPLAKSIEARGGRIDTGCGLESVLVERVGEGLAVAGAVIGGASGGIEQGSEPVASFAPGEVPESGFRADPSGSVWIGRRDSGFCAFSAQCLHAGGSVEWLDAQRRFVCRRHGGTFQSDGSPASGPPRQPLIELATRERGGAVEVLGRRRSSHPGVRDVIVATELPAATRILAASEGVPPALNEQLAALDTTPVVVVRMWFEAGIRVPEAETVLLPEPRIADVYFHLNAFDAGYDREGTVIEIHACDPDERWTQESDDAILAAALEDLGLLSDELCNAKLRRGNGGPLYRVQRHRASFTLFAPGNAGLRPGVESGVAGLHLAGDWTRADWSVWMMERAVVSGLRAANCVLERRGLRPVPIERPPREGWLLRASRWAARRLRRGPVVARGS